MTPVVAAINLLVILSIAFWAGKRQGTALKPVFWAALILKLAAGIALGLVYRYYYPVGDTFALFRQAAELTAKLYEDPGAYFDFLWNSNSGDYKGHLRSGFFVKVVSLVNVFTASNYWITGLWLSLTAFFAAWHIFRIILRNFEGTALAAAFAVLFFPSALFWSSGIIKECLALAGLFVLAASWINGMQGKMPRAVEVVLDLVALWVVWNLKYYWAAVFVPVALAALIIGIGLKKKKFTVWTIVLATGVVVLLGFAVTFLHPNFYPDYFLTVLVDNHDAFVRLSTTDNLIRYHDLKPAWMSVLLNSPWALFSGLFRPFIGESAHGLTLFASAENLVVLVLFLGAVYGRAWRSSRYGILIFSGVIYTVVLCIFLSLSTPNFGSLARYKAGFLPFFVFLITVGNPLLKTVADRFEKLINR